MRRVPAAPIFAPARGPGLVRLLLLPHRPAQDPRLRLMMPVSTAAAVLSNGANMNPIPVSEWENQGNVWPTANAWRHMLRPENLRDELTEAGVCNKVNGRWVIFPAAWQRYCAKAQSRKVA